MTRNLLAAASALALAACATVGPNYDSPQPEAPAQTGFLSSATSPAFSGDEPPGRWWSLFGDPELDALVQEALTRNTDLRVAAANLAQARAVLRETRTQRLPTTDINAGVTLDRPSPAQLGLPEGSDVDISDNYSLGFDVGYQLDLFGRIRRAIEASRADVEAVQATFDVTRISVAAETARAYADVCSAGRQLAVARETVRIQSETFDLTRRLVEGGRGTALETGQAGALLEQTRAQIPALEAQRQTALYRLSVLTGRPPADFPREVADCVTPPTVAQPIPVGSGATLLARRPDIRAAERRLAAATARIGVATADLYPDIAIGASVGTAGGAIGDLVSEDGFSFSLGPFLSWRFPNTSAARARIAQAEAATAATLAQFDGTWLGALEETESALTRYARELERVAAFRRARTQGAEAARIARLRYQAGREGFQVVLDAERTLADIDAGLAAAEAQLSDYLVSVFLALGGGWQDAPPVVVQTASGALSTAD